MWTAWLAASYCFPVAQLNAKSSLSISLRVRSRGTLVYVAADTENLNLVQELCSGGNVCMHVVLYVLL